MGGGKATPTWAKTRWRDLRDSYVKARKKARAYIPSGSDAESATKLRSTSFRFFKQMQFLEVAYTTETTISSLDPIPLQISQNSNADLDGCFSGAVTNVDALTVPLGPSPIKVPSGPLSAPLLLISETAVTRASPALTKKRKYQDTDPSGVATDADALTLLQRPSPIIVEPSELLSAPLLLTSETAVTPKTSPALTKNKKSNAFLENKRSLLRIYMSTHANCLFNNFYFVFTILHNATHSFGSFSFLRLSKSSVFRRCKPLMSHGAEK
ncbi:uncharacterized protein [Linepithema humile]|uniref:uncharacterized protein n=1 Tax=Linepithema humile TaxID=83485 RepID=UPI00351F25FE